MAAVLTLLNVTQDSTLNQFIVDGIIAFTGTYPQHGDTLSFAGQPQIPSNSLPNEVYVYEATPAPGPPSGWEAIYCPGTTQANGIVSFFNGTTELGNGQTYSSAGNPTAPVGALWKFKAYFPSFI